MSDTATPSFVTPRVWPSWTLISALIIMLSLLAFQLGRRDASHTGAAGFAVIDLADIVSKHQEISIAALAESSVDDNSRARALAKAKAFGKQLDDAIIQLSRECGCVLLVREAVVAGQVDDLTPALRARLAQK